MLRLTLGPREHGTLRNVVTPSLILDADHQPGPFPGGGSDYFVEAEIAHRYSEELVETGRDVYINIAGENSPVVGEDGQPQRPILLSVFTTFHPNLNALFANAMNTRERLVIGILSYLVQFGHSLNTTNLYQYAGLFEQREKFSLSSAVKEKPLAANSFTTESKKAPNVLVHVGDLSAKRTFPSRRTFNHVYRNSIFCPIPPGDVPHGSRFFHAILSGCIPVVLIFNSSVPGLVSWHMDRGAPWVDSYPFTNKIDYPKIVVQVPAQDIISIVEVLQAVPDEVIREKQQYMLQIRNYFINDYSGKVVDSFSCTLLEILDRLD